MGFDRIFHDLQLIGDQLVGISSCNQGQNVDFPLTQRADRLVGPQPVQRYSSRNHGPFSTK